MRKWNETYGTCVSVHLEGSNYMANHEEWFSHLEKPKQSGVVETSDDTSHPIKHIGDIPVSNVD